MGWVCCKRFCCRDGVFRFLGECVCLLFVCLFGGVICCVTLMVCQSGVMSHFSFLSCSIFFSLIFFVPALSACVSGSPSLTHLIYLLIDPIFHSSIHLHFQSVIHSTQSSSSCICHICLICVQIFINTYISTYIQILYILLYRGI